jgi:hypothetical protein
MEQDKQLLWYSKAELCASQTAEKEDLQRYVEAHTDYVAQLLQLWSSPLVQVQSKLVAPLLQAPRGLEKHSLKHVMRQRQEVVLRRVLQAQHNFTAPWMDNTESLRRECEPLTRTSMRFAKAKAMAKADAMAVQALDD